MAVVSPFAQIQDSLPPLTPPPMMSPMDAQGMGSSGAPSVFAPMPKVTQDQNPAHQVQGAFANSNPSEAIQLHEQQKLAKDYQKDADPYGSADNHPGFWGKIAHGLNVATGGENRRGWEEMGLQKSLQELLKEQSTEGEQGATTSHLNEETAEMPGKTQSEEELQGATTRHTSDEAANLENPAPVVLETDQGIFLRNPKTNELTPLTNQGKPLMPFNKTAPKGMEKGDIVGPDGKPMEANFHPDTGKWTDTTGKEIVNPKPYEKPNQAGMITMIAPDPNNPGGGVVERLGAGAKVAPGAQTTAGFNSMNTPTTNQRTASGRAENVLAMVPEVTSRLDAMKGQIGPEMGRWNEFMQGRVGTNNPQFAALRSDLLMMSSAVALAHAQGRLPENLREEFDNAINAPKQTPENLKATINAMVPWLEQVRDQGERPGTPHAPVNEPTRPANVPEGYTFKDGPKGKGWYAPTAK